MSSYDNYEVITFAPSFIANLVKAVQKLLGSKLPSLIDKSVPYKVLGSSNGYLVAASIGLKTSDSIPNGFPIVCNLLYSSSRS